MTEYSKLAALISSEFNRYLIEHDEIADKIPQNSLVVFQVENELSTHSKITSHFY